MLVWCYNPDADVEMAKGIFYLIIQMKQVDSLLILIHQSFSGSSDPQKINFILTKFSSKSLMKSNCNASLVKKLL